MSNLNALTLADWRRQVANIYEGVRQSSDVAQAWCDYRAKRDKLFRFHPQTPLNNNQLAKFQTIPYFEYDPDYRVIGRLDTAVSPTLYEVELPAEGMFRFKKFADVHFELKKQPFSLGVYWIEAYGGGIFLPFRDETNGESTYGGGRYLYDSIKGADLNNDSNTFVLDFNFAYNPSCAYNDQWVCPLSPPENKLPFSIKAGEQQLPTK